MLVTPCTGVTPELYWQTANESRACLQWENQLQIPLQYSNTFHTIRNEVSLHLESLKDPLNVQSCNAGSWSSSLPFGMHQSSLSIIKILLETDLLPLFLLHLCAKHVSVNSELQIYWN